MKLALALATLCTLSTATLAANESKVKNLAKRLPYLNGFKS